MNAVESDMRRVGEVNPNRPCNWYVIGVKGYILAWANEAGGMNTPADTRKLNYSIRSHARRDAERKRSCLLCIMHKRDPANIRKCMRQQVVRIDPSGPKLVYVRQSVYVIIGHDSHAIREAFATRMAHLATSITGRSHRFHRDVTSPCCHDFLGDILPAHEAVKTWQMGKALLVSDILQRPEWLREIFRWNHLLVAEDFLSPVSSPAMVEEDIEDVNRDMISPLETSHWSEEGVLYCLTSDEEGGNRMRVNP